MKIYEGTLTRDSVSVLSKEFGTRAYANSGEGRAALGTECPPGLAEAVLVIWGDVPTVETIEDG